VVFPGHSDGCDCKLRIANEFCSAGIDPYGHYVHTLYVDGCDCIHITAFEPPEETLMKVSCMAVRAGGVRQITRLRLCTSNEVDCCVELGVFS